MGRLLLVALTLIVCVAADAASITVSTEPGVPIVELTRSGQALNFDILLTNASSKAREVEMVELTVRDAKGGVVMQRRVGQNGDTIEVIPARTLAANGRLLIFNPLWQWPADVSLDRIEIALQLGSEEGPSELVKYAVHASPGRKARSPGSFGRRRLCSRRPRFHLASPAFPSAFADDGRTPDSA